MDRILVFFAAVVPGLLILFYGVTKTGGYWNNEALGRAFLMGGVAAVACIPIEFALSYSFELSGSSPTFGAFLRALFVAAIPEEFAKFFVLISVAERDVDVRRKQDILLLALGISLGFATLENLFFVAGGSDWHLIAAGRAVTAVPGHGIYGLIMGALLTAARLRLQNFPVALALFVPILLHAAYDFPLFILKNGFQLWALIMWLAVLLFCALAAIYLCNRILPCAAEADRLSGVDVRTQSSWRGLATGILLTVGGPAIAVAVILTKFGDFAWLAPLVAILPIALGLDLLWSAWQRRAY
jgi:protease PrsW